MEELDFAKDQIKEVEAKLAVLLDGTGGKWLLTIPGIDVAPASVIAGEIGDPGRFDGPHKLMAFAGMDPTRSESGDTVSSDGRMSKRGPGTLRRALMMAADCARKHDPYFGDYYAAKKRVDGKHRYVALSGVARKLMGVCLAVMKEGRPYGRPRRTTNPATSRRPDPALRQGRARARPFQRFRAEPPFGMHLLSHIRFSRFLLKSLRFPLDS